MAEASAFPVEANPLRGEHFGLQNENDRWVDGCWGVLHYQDRIFPGVQRGSQNGMTQTACVRARVCVLKLAI